MYKRWEVGMREREYVGTMEKVGGGGGGGGGAGKSGNFNFLPKRIPTGTGVVYCSVSQSE